jgi:hypothetical protein
MNDTPEIIIAGIPIQKAGARSHRISMLLWGSSGSGKTTLACTAPGSKLLISFDPDGSSSVANRDDVDVLDLSSSNGGIAEKFKSPDPLGLKKVIEDYDTIIVDSLTSVQAICLERGISGVKGATVERPSPGAYGTRNSLTLILIKNMLRITGAAGKHIIFIAHEGAPVTNADGLVMHISMMLGGQLPEQASLNFSEVWALTDTGKERRIAVRPIRSRKPMKTRMFATPRVTDAEFQSPFDADALEGDGIAEWYAAWVKAGYTKIPVPK